MLKILNWAYDMAVKNAVAKTDVLLEIGTKVLKKTAFDEAFGEILDTDPELHNAYLRIISEALKRSRMMGR